MARIKADASSGHSTTKAQTERLTRRLEEQDMTGVLPQPVWQETIYRLMITDTSPAFLPHRAFPRAAERDSAPDMPKHRSRMIASEGLLPYFAPMKLIRDCFGHSVRLTDERLAHILEHAEMAGMEDEIERVLQAPSEVRVSRSDNNVKLFYEFYTQTQVGGKWLCVVVKYSPGDAFVVTAYFSDTLKAGETVWPKR